MTDTWIHEKCIRNFGLWDVRERERERVIDSAMLHYLIQCSI